MKTLEFRGLYIGEVQSVPKFVSAVLEYYQAVQLFGLCGIGMTGPVDLLFSPAGKRSGFLKIGAAKYDRATLISLQQSGDQFCALWRVD